MGDVIKAVILGIVEGVTEFLPVSSTGHLVLAQRWMGIDLEKDPFWGMFAVFIQLGAIMSVVVYFREKLMLLLLGPRALRKEPAQIPAEADARPHLTDGPPAGGMTETERRRTLLMIAIATAPLVLAYFANEWSEKNMNSPAVVAWALAC
jgi:undecaprenyl pyrophosphate phosphatase UppP